MPKNSKDKPSQSPQENQEQVKQEPINMSEASEQNNENLVLTKEEMAEIKKMYETLEEQKKRLEDDKDQYLRLCAEYDNFRKRSVREKELLYTDIKADTFAALLPVYDNLERAVKQQCSDEAFGKGVQMIMNQFDEILKKHGVEEIEALGKDFDPNLHNGVMHEENEALGVNVISEVLQKGFKLGDRVIRFSMVKVAN